MTRFTPDEIARMRSELAAPALILPDRMIDQPFQQWQGCFGMGFIGSAGKSAPLFVAAGTSSDFNTGAYTSTPGLPAAWAIGDLFVLMILVKRVGGANPVVPATGYTLLMQQNDSASDVDALIVYYRFAQSGDAAPTLTISNGSDYFGGSRIMAYRGVNTSTPFEATTGVSKGAQATSSSYNQITTTGPGRTVLQMFGAENNRTSTPNSGWTERVDTQFNSNSALAVNEQVFASPGLTSSGAITWSGAVASDPSITTALVPA